MLKKDRSRKKYLSDLTDEQWAIVEPLIPPAKQSPRGGRPRQVEMREVLNTIFYLNRSGCQWEMLPHDLLPKSTVYDYFAQGRDDGTWATLVKAWRERTRVEVGHEPPPVPRASIVNRSRPPRSVVPSAGMMGARKSKAASGICWLIRWGCCLSSLLPALVSMMGSPHRSCSAASHHRMCRVWRRSLRIRSITITPLRPGWPSIVLGGSSR
jgi:transposase